MQQFERVADARLYLSIIAAGILSFTGVVIETSMNVIFPTLMEEFHISTSLVQWVTTGYLLILSVIIPTSSYLKQRFPLKRLFLCANLIFLTGTLCGAFAPNFYVLLLGRLLQGTGTGIALPLMFNIVMEQAPLNRIGFMMGAAMLVTALAPAVGPSFGGYIVTAWGWHMIFLSLVPVVLFSLFTGLYAIRQSCSYGPRAFDFTGMFQIAVAFTTFLLACTEAWARRFARTIIALKSQGFAIYITTDHGNVLSTGAGTLSSAEKTHLFADGSRGARHPQRHRVSRLPGIRASGTPGRGARRPA